MMTDKMNNAINELLTDINNLVATYDNNPDTTDYYQKRRLLMQHEIDTADKCPAIVDFKTRKRC